MLNVKGIGPETADSIILYAFKKPIFVIDTYTKRLITRLGLIDTDLKTLKYNELQNLFHKKFSRDMRNPLKAPISFFLLKIPDLEFL